MKRAKPDPYRFAVWVAANIIFDEGRSHRARAIWNLWSMDARELGVEAGTPRSVSNALRKLGCPAYLAYRRTRCHRGLKLKLPEPGGMYASDPLVRPYLKSVILEQFG